jgi:Fungal N-terminal domain of STAND proteins
MSSEDITQESSVGGDNDGNVVIQICDQLSEHINQIQLTLKRSASSPGPIDPDAIPERVTNKGLQECKNGLVLTVARLERHMKDIIDRLVTKSKTAMTSEDEVADLARLQEEWETARQCMDICSKADNHLKKLSALLTTIPATPFNSWFRPTGSLFMVV